MIPIVFQGTFCQTQCLAQDPNAAKKRPQLSAMLSWNAGDGNARLRVIDQTTYPEQGFNCSQYQHRIMVLPRFPCPSLPHEIQPTENENFDQQKMVFKIFHRYSLPWCLAWLPLLWDSRPWDSCLVFSMVFHPYLVIMSSYFPSMFSSSCPLPQHQTCP